MNGERIKQSSNNAARNIVLKRRWHCTIDVDWRVQWHLVVALLEVPVVLVALHIRLQSCQQLWRERSGSL